MKLAVAIIIDGRGGEPKICIESVMNQVGVDNLALDIFVCSTGEVDLPEEFLQRKNVKVISGAKTEFGVTGYLHKLADSVKNHDWVWTIVSNHYLYSKNALNFLVDSLSKDECEHAQIATVGFAGKSYDSSIVDVRSLTDLCNAHGFLEMLGNASPLVIRGHAFETAFGNPVNEMASLSKTVKNTDTIWWHAKLLFMALHNQKGAFIDYKLLGDVNLNEDLRPVDKTSSAHTNTSRLASDLIELNFAVGDNTLWSPKFFRVGQESIWHTFACEQYKRALDYSEAVAHSRTDHIEMFDAIISNWQLMLTLSECVGNQKVQETLKQLVIDGIRHTMMLHQEPKLSDAGKRYFENCTAVTKIFSATTLDAAFVSERA
jgi:hypothetical protein